MPLDIGTTKVTARCAMCQDSIETPLVNRWYGTVTAAIERLEAEGRRQGWNVPDKLDDWTCKKHRP